MKKESIWLQNISFNKSPRINKSDSVDVLIIGGGITGLSTAYHLTNSNLKVYLVEQNLIAHGVSARTTGKLTYLQDNIYTKLKDKASLYYKSQKDSIEIVQKIIGDNKIECDNKKVLSFLYTNDKNQIDKIKREESQLKNLNINYKIYNNLPFNVECKYAISVDDTYVFNPLKYLNSLKKIIVKKGIEIYENSRVT